MMDWQSKLNTIIQGDVRERLKEIPDGVIDMVITSPPYWGLRAYSTEPQIWGGDEKCEHQWKNYNWFQHSGRGDCQKSGKYSEQEPIIDKPMNADFCWKCNAWRGELGLEPHPQMFIDHIVGICRELRRVLKDTGSMWLNLGDTYYNNPSNSGDSNLGNVSALKQVGRQNRIKYKSNWLQPKQLMLMPSRIAIALQDDGWILRNDVVWHKVNPMPSSVKDRLNNCYEHLFHFVKQRQYYYDLDAIREPHSHPENMIRKVNASQHGTFGESGLPDNVGSVLRDREAVYNNPAGKNPGDVFTLSTQPFPEAHFATYPEALIEKPILACCPEWVCDKCGEARMRITKPSEEYEKFIGKSWHNHKFDKSKGNIRDDTVGHRTTANYTTIGFTTCPCDNPTYSGGVVLDPFMGSGTTAVVCIKNNRQFIGIELSQEYIDKIAIPRLNSIEGVQTARYYKSTGNQRELFK